MCERGLWVFAHTLGHTHTHNPCSHPRRSPWEVPSETVTGRSTLLRHPLGPEICADEEALGGV